MTDEERTDFEWEFEALQQPLTIHQLHREDFAMTEAEWEEYQNNVLDRMNQIRRLLQEDK